DAVMRNLEILGEAAKHIPSDVRARMPGVAWREIAGMRDWLAHRYFTINAGIVWDALTLEVPLLLRTLEEFDGPDAQGLSGGAGPADEPGVGPSGTTHDG